MNKSKIRIGESRVMNNGQKATIIGYRGARDIDVKFDDNTVVKSKQYCDFIKGLIKNPNRSPRLTSRVNETRIMNNGQKATIINYRSANDIDVRFEDGAVVKNRIYEDFVKGQIKNFKRPANYKAKREGLQNISNQGFLMTIIAYRGSKDIDVRFEDGAIVTNRRYADFQSGEIGHPIRDYMIKKGCVGKEQIMNNGQKATIIAYRKAVDIDIQFEDGTVVEHKQYASFCNGAIRNPTFKKQKKREDIKENKKEDDTCIVNSEYNDVDYER